MEEFHSYPRWLIAEPSNPIQQNEDSGIVIHLRAPGFFAKWAYDDSDVDTNSPTTINFDGYDFYDFIWFDDPVLVESELLALAKMAAHAIDEYTGN